MSTDPYTAVVVATGDGRRNARAVSTDGVLDLAIGIPKEVGGDGSGTNPEQLFAAGWSACFHSALKYVAAQRKVKITDSAVVAEVTLNEDPSQGFFLSAVLRLELSGLSQEEAQELAEAAHQVCPYSKATRGNIDVKIEATAL